MGQNLTLRGIPASILRDSWWLTADPDPRSLGADENRYRGGSIRARLAALIALIAVADILFWEQRFGISLAAFSVATFLLSVWDIRPRKSLGGPALLLALSILPVIEYVQFLSVLFLFAGLTTAIVWARADKTELSAILAAWGAFLRGLPRHWGETLVFPVRLALGRPLSRQPQALSSSWRILLRNWAFPVGGGLIFASLLMDANPLLERAFQLELDGETLFRRGLFWLGIAVMCWPLLDVRTDALAVKSLPKRWRGVNLGLNPGSVLRSLWLFNALIGIQTVLDLSILIGGAELPDGMSYAEYAHRGAYPLLMTAILAGIFALLARQFLAEHRALKPLMLLWLGQNVALCVSALLRLDLYIDSFGLTYLRVHALIWMCLVAAGLGLTAWQVQRGHGNGWLLKRITLLGLGSLYLACFVNFAQIIAAQNLSRTSYDAWYVCNLGPTASAGVAKADLGALSTIFANGVYGCRLSAPEIEGWRDWGFRKWRVLSYVAAEQERDRNEPDIDRR